MPVIRKDDKGNIVKEGSNGCEDCGFKSDNTEILQPAVKEEKAESKKKKSKKDNDEVNEDVS